MPSTPQSEPVDTNQLLQAVTEMVRRLRQGSGRNGLILANGGFLSYQHALCLAVSPRKEQTCYPDSRRFESSPSDPIPPIDSEAEGRAKIEVRGTSPALRLSVSRVYLLMPFRHTLLNSAETGIHNEPTLWAVFWTTTIAFWRTMATRRRSASYRRPRKSPLEGSAW